MCVSVGVCVCVSVLDLVSLRTQHAAALSSLLLLRDNVAVQVTYLKYEIFSKLTSRKILWPWCLGAGCLLKMMSPMFC